jgi:hypothetical protein
MSVASLLCTTVLRQIGAASPSGLGHDEFAALIRRQFAAGANLVKTSGAQMK